MARKVKEDVKSDRDKKSGPPAPPDGPNPNRDIMDSSHAARTAQDIVEPNLHIPLHVSRRSDLTSSTKLVFGVIASHARIKEFAWPGVRRIAELTGLNPDTVHNAVISLVRASLITTQASPGRTTVYRLTASVRKNPTPFGNTVHFYGLEVCGKNQQGVRTSPTNCTEKTEHNRNSIDIDRKALHAASKPAEKTVEETIPSSLDTPAFRQAWLEWKAYKAEGGKKLTTSTANRQLVQLSALAPDVAIASIEHSITKGWSLPVYPDNQSHTGNGRPPAQLVTFDQIKLSVQRENAQLNMETHHAQ